MSTFLLLYFPESFLILSTLFLLLFNSILITSIKFKFPILNFEIFFQLCTILILTFFLLNNISFININYNIFFFNNYNTQNLKILILIIYFNFFFLIWKSFMFQKLNFFEYFIISLLIVLSLFFLINSSNIISIYLCLEIQALGFYILSSFYRNSLFSSEAGLKYFISSSLISGIFLFGSVLLYGSLGTLNLLHITFFTTYFFTNFTNYYLLIFFLGAFLILNTLLFKLVIAPFHFWFPQIYDGAPLSTTIFLSSIPKIALINLFLYFWSTIYMTCFFFNTFFFIIGLYSTFFGIFKMLKQKRLKKLYIYSSISNFGLLLCLLIDTNLDSIFFIYFFLIIYLITLFLLWFILIIFYSNKILNNKYTNQKTFSIFLINFNSIFIQNKLFAISICFIFFSLAALPPFCGFFSKFFIFFILLKNYKYEFSIFLIYLGIFGSYYYIKFLKIICFEPILLIKQQQIFNLFNIPFLNLDSFLYSLYLFFLIFLFFFPQFLLNLLLFF